MRRQVVAVIGASRPSPEELVLAECVGALVANHGLILLSGGLGGVMEAASRGAHREGGLVVGILPQADPGAGNSYVDIAIATGMSDARNAIIANTADAFVAVGGGLGTLSEIAFALKRGKLVCALRTWKLDESRLEGVEWLAVQTPEEAVTCVHRHLCGPQAADPQDACGRGTSHGQGS